VNTEEIVPRADFVSGVAKMIGLTKYDGDAYYYDVPENHWAFNEVSALTQAGILNGTGNKLFKPDDKMTKSEGYKIIATILGYGDWAQYSGGYPTGYIAAANRADISDGVSSSEYITVSDMIRIFYNAITTSMLEPVAYGTKDVTYSANGHNTILSVYRDVYYAEGRVTGANCSSFDGMALDEGKIIIDNIIYDSEVDAGDYLGEKVKFFYEAYYTEMMEKEPLPFNPNIDHSLMIEILKEFGETLNIDQCETDWFNGLKALAAKYSFAANAKEYKKNRELYKGHVGDVAEMIRISLTSSKQSPNLYYILRILKKEEVNRRIKKAIEFLK